MKCLIFTILIPLVFLIICAFGGSAHASSWDSKVQALYSPELVETIIKGQVERNKNRHYSSSRAETGIRAIDDRQDAIEISQERTSLPSDYMAMPTSKRDMERYNGR